MRLGLGLGLGARRAGGVPLVFPSGLTHRWTLNEASGHDRVDSVGDLDLEESGGAVASAAGKHGNGANFIATEQLVADPCSIARPYSIVVWVKLTSPTPENTNGGYVFKSSEEESGSFTSLAAALTADEFGELSFHRADFSPNSDEEGVLSNTGLAADTWQMLCGTVEANGNFHFSINGAAFASSGAPAVETDFTGPLAVGASGCLIDEIMIFNRALTQQEVTNLWNGGAGLFAD